MVEFGWLLKLQTNLSRLDSVDALRKRLTDKIKSPDESDVVL